jgi:hypothetical protein
MARLGSAALCPVIDELAVRDKATAGYGDANVSYAAHCDKRIKRHRVINSCGGHELRARSRTADVNAQKLARVWFPNMLTDQ